MVLDKNVTNWGHIFDKSNLHQQLPQIFDFISTIYWEEVSTNKEKIMSIYSAIYRSPKKELMKGKIMSYHTNMSGDCKDNFTEKY